MWLLNGFCTPLHSLRGTKWIGMSKTKLPLFNKLCTLCRSISSLSLWFILPPHSSLTPSGGLWEGRARWSKEDLQSHSVRAMLLPAYLSRTPLLPHSPCFDANRVVGHRWLHNGERTQCILGALLGTNDSQIRCVWSPGPSADGGAGWRGFMMVIFVCEFNSGASARKLLYGSVSIKPVL